jgi:serine/threonine protein phosphatase PrpC
MKNIIIEHLNECVNTTKVGALGDGTAILATTIGEVRKENEDRAVIAKINSLNSEKVISCYLVSDGMGGMQEGSLASSMTISIFLTSMQESLNKKIEIKDCISNSIFNSNNDVFNRLKGKGGATLSVVVVDSDQSIYICNVGDSRIYNISDKSNLTQLTKDDDIKNLLKDINNAGLNKELAKRNGLTKFIGMGEDLIVNVTEVSSCDNILLTSDGLHRIGDKLLSELHLNSKSEHQFIQRSISLANWLGGHDNATAILISPLNFKKEFFSLDKANDYIGIWDFRGFYKFILETILIEKVKPINKKAKKVEDNTKDKVKNDTKDDLIQVTFYSDKNENGEIQ